MGGFKMKNNSLEKLKKEYMDIPIPQELDFVVKKALKESRSNSTTMASKGRLRKAAVVAASTAACVAVLTIGVNTSPAFAKTLSKIPVVSSIVKVLTFREYTVDEDTFNANIKVPEISGLKDEKLQSSLNEKYLKENEKLYEQFIADMEDMKQNGGGHLGVDSGYVVKTDTDRILSIGRYVVNTVGSSSTTFKYDTIDKKNEVLITLPSLFKDDSYVDTISENIKEQMKMRHEADDNMIYWVEGIEDEGLVELFEKISKEQNFYINSDDKLVISFDKYDVAPGYMGIQEFVIPTQIISDILVSNEYIK
ncbi:Anti-sigma-V factor RsiV [Tepidanaerobacter acetatoxydans Re1]|uniref:Anti-sigma-V factor RsiV n=2 Tax=Tepidanaerobacter acetatoxydans TaxID=499229 RepID=U4QKT9_TEPAE|nr:Anti-sigma-V factor RsiV [Tepidanaerobacter acetatoxydans Re1]